MVTWRWAYMKLIQTMSKHNPDSDGFNLDMDNVEGATIPVELAWKPKVATFNSLPGEYKLGALYSTAEAKDVGT